jgi:cytochrome c-type biogenesis protein CcmH
MIWLLLALIASLVVLALVVPVLRRPAGGTATGMSVFAGQLEELRRDVELGLVASEEARAAELDIKRRALAAQSRNPADGAPSRALRLALIAGSVASAMVAVIVYMAIGSPQLVGQPAAPSTDTPEEMREVMAEIDALAADLMANPENPRGWAVLGEAYSALGRHREAIVAFENAIDRVPDSAYLFASLGQAHLFAARGEMTPAAREAFARALDLEPENVRARFFTAEALYQEGNREAALAAWQALLEDAPEDAGYRPMVEARLATAREENGG